MRQTTKRAAGGGRLVGLALAAALTGGLAAAQQPKELKVPELDIGETMMEARRLAQLDAVKELEVQHDFRFTDRQPESGVTFHQHPVDDGAIEYKMVHYDHGNGVAAADIDGDGLIDVYFTTELGSNGMFRNLGGGRFEDVTESSGTGLPNHISMGAAFADIDNDGDPDLYVTTVRHGDVLFENVGEGVFRDITEQAGLAYSGHSSSGVFFDYDRDGLVDLLLTNVGVFTTDEQGRGGYYIGVDDAFQGHLHPERTERSVLYRNLGGRHFADVTAKVGLMDGSWSGDAGIADVDGDGFLDVYLMNMEGDDHFWQNQGGERFVERTADLFPKTPWGSMGIKFFDFDNNGGLDLLITDMHSDMSADVDPPLENNKSIITWSEEFLQGGANNIWGNAFYRNDGAGAFEEVSDQVGAENYWPWGPSVGDLNADGWEDVFIASSMCFPFRYGINTVLLNDEGRRFAHSEFALGVEPRRDGRTRAPWFDLDCSGADAGHSLCAGREGPYTVTGTLGTRSAVIFDVDQDGDLDIVTLEFNAEPQVLISDLAEQHPPSFLELRLEGTRSNRSGLGAMIRVHVGERTLVRSNDGKSGYLGQSDMPLYVGLDGASKVDSIEVVWPSGTHQTVTEGIRMNGLTRIVEPEAG